MDEDILHDAILEQNEFIVRILQIQIRSFEMTTGKMNQRIGTSLQRSLHWFHDASHILREHQVHIHESRIDEHGIIHDALDEQGVGDIDPLEPTISERALGEYTPRGTRISKIEIPEQGLIENRTHRTCSEHAGIEEIHVTHVAGEEL